MKGIKSSIVPITVTPERMAIFGLYRSARYPARGRSSPEIMKVKAKAKDIEPRLQPNSSVIGLRNTPKENWPPDTPKDTSTHPATTNQP